MQHTLTFRRSHSVDNATDAVVVAAAVSVLHERINATFAAAVLEDTGVRTLYEHISVTFTPVLNGVLCTVGVH